MAIFTLDFIQDYLSESYIVNQKDIYYNKGKFDSGEINLCFITGLSGSGKSTMAHSKEGDTVEAVELDDLEGIKDKFSMDNLKEYGDLIYSFFNGPGKRLYLTKEEIKNLPQDELNNYDSDLYKGFVHYSMDYSKSHKDKKFIIEGVQLFGHSESSPSLFNPSEFDDYAFYIKGTSMLISKIRAAKRDAKNNPKKSFAKRFFTKNWKWYFIDEKDLKRFRDYFIKKMKDN